MECVITKVEDGIKVQAEIFKLKAQFDKGKIFTCTINPRNKMRSLDANAYFWNLAEELAKKHKATKVEIYKKYIREYGVCDIRPIRDDEVETFVKRWERLGIGWFCEDLGTSKLQGYTNVRSYYGSSIYEQPEMSRIIDAIVEDCKKEGIETRTPNQIAEMISLWGGSE